MSDAPAVFTPLAAPRPLPAPRWTRPRRAAHRMLAAATTGAAAQLEGARGRPPRRTARRHGAGAGSDGVPALKIDPASGAAACCRSQPATAAGGRRHQHRSASGGHGAERRLVGARRTCRDRSAADDPAAGRGRYFMPRGMVTLPGARPRRRPRRRRRPRTTTLTRLPGGGGAGRGAGGLGGDRDGASAPALPTPGQRAAPGVRRAARCVSGGILGQDWTPGRRCCRACCRPGERSASTARRRGGSPIGNAAATQVNFRGQPVTLTGVSRDNVARMELK